MPINVSDELDLGVAGYETQRYTRGEVFAPGHSQLNTVVRIVADALVATKVLEFTVVKLNEDTEVDVYTLTDYENGVKPFGLTATSVEEGEVGQSIPVITNGKFNPERVIFDASFTTVQQKRDAFDFPGSNIQMTEHLYQGIE
jgi:hypothetical protein